tara:strand:- start:2102 stop:2722 length:621 start_codon:yes stop_codon:yes gene_type:complete
MPLVTSDGVVSSPIQTKKEKPQTTRSYHMTPDKLSEYWTKRQVLGSYVNPLKRDGAYKAQIQTLITLGTDEWHSHAKVEQEMPAVCSTLTSKTVWHTFSNRDEREKAPKPKDLGGKITQNFEVLQRLTGEHPYGAKLMQAHSSIDIMFIPFGETLPYSGPVKDKKGTYYYKLNTTFKCMEDVVPFSNYKGKRRGRPKKTVKSPATS